jgi:glutaredoxin
MSIKKLLLVSILAWAAWASFKAHQRGHVPALDNPTAENLRTLAATVQAGDVVMYSTSECPYCAEAKSWLNQHGFAFTECNMSVNKQCITEFKSYGADGTPFLIVRGHQMKDGFDSDEFIAALSKS